MPPRRGSAARAAAAAATAMPASTASKRQPACASFRRYQGSRRNVAEVVGFAEGPGSYAHVLQTAMASPFILNATAQPARRRSCTTSPQYQARQGKALLRWALEARLPSAPWRLRVCFRPQTWGWAQRAQRAQHRQRPQGPQAGVLHSIASCKATRNMFSGAPLQ